MAGACIFTDYAGSAEHECSEILTVMLGVDNFRLEDPAPGVPIDEIAPIVDCYNWFT